MRGIGGNLQAEIQIRTGNSKNAIGERVPTWETVQTLTGWLDMLSGEAKRSTYNAKIEESTHIFISDFVPLDERITAENSRAVIRGKVYDITFIDNPMELDYQLEIFLKYSGGKNG